MTAWGFPLVLALLGQTAVPMPTDEQGAWMWVALILASALAFVSREWLKDMREGRKQDREQIDKLTATLPEIVSLFREWKEANNGRPPVQRS